MSKLKTISLSDLKFLAIQLLIITTFGLAALGKWQAMGVPDHFIDQFGDTWLASLPGNLFLPFYTIVVAETAAFLLAMVSLVRVEFISGRDKKWLKYALVVTLFIFVILGYGLRLVSEFDGTANAFFYFGVTLFALYLTEKESQKAMDE